MTRIALLGATGSIGRQALEIIESHPELELCAATSGASSLDHVLAVHPVARLQVGGDPTGVLDASEPDVVLNAIVGFAGIGATLWALEHGVTLALANKESLVAGGALARAAHDRGGGLLIPVDSEHSAIRQCLEGRSLATCPLARPDRVRWAVPRARPGRARLGNRRGGARTSDLEHGTKDHRGLRDAREQGARADRGALAVRAAVRPHRGGRARVVDRARPRALPRRSCARAPWLPGHARPDLLRAHVPGACGDAGACTRPVRGAHPVVRSA